MQQVVLKYNPYKVETSITVNGAKPKKNSQLVQFEKQRFQLWVDQIPTLLEDEYNDNQFKITFYGTDLDYQDLIAATNEAKLHDLHFEMKKMPAKEFGDKETEIRNIFERAQKLPFEQLQSKAVKDSFEKAFSALLDVNVVATMSAGKSTLINALLGKKLMPSKNGACTATITKIQDDDDKTFKAKVKFKDGNPDANYSCLDYETMKNLNADKNVYEIEAKGDIPFVTSEEVALVLIDTPGPDNALDSRHGEVTARALDESSKMLVLFVMNGGKINDESQNKFLQSIAKSMSVGGKQSRERFLFVINKLDSYDAEDDDIANETLPETVKNLEKMGIENPNIFPVAALPALLIREYQNISDPERKKKILNQVKPIAEKMVEQGQLHLEQYPHLPHGCQEKIKQELQHAIEANDILGQALVHSGIRGIEETIKLYVTKYCRPAKITNIVQTFGAGLQSAEAVTNTEKEILSQTENLKKIEKRLKQLKSKLVSREENERFKKQISNLALSSEIEQEINNIIKDFEIPLTDCFKDAPAEMEEDKAMSLAKKFAMVANQKQEEFKIKVSNIIDKDINNKGQQLVKEYRKKLAILSEEFSGEGLKINLDSYVQGTILSLDPYQAVNNSLDVRIEKHDEERVRTEKRRRSGWDRLFHPSSWFNPEYDVLVKHMVEVREEVSFISREKLSNLLVSPIRSTIYSERDNVVKFASEQTQIIKESFYKQFDEVDTILAKILNSYQQDTASEVAAKKALARAQDLSEQLKILQKELDDILSI